MTKKFAILVEYEVPEWVDWTVQAASPALDTLRSLPFPATPTLVTAFAGEAAEAMAEARKEAS